MPFSHQIFKILMTCALFLQSRIRKVVCLYVWAKLMNWPTEEQMYYCMFKH